MTVHDLPYTAGFERFNHHTDAAGSSRSRSAYRDPGEPDFSDEEAAFLAEISSTLAEGFRRALLISSITTEENPDGPGLLLLDDEDNVTSITPRQSVGWTSSSTWAIRWQVGCPSRSPTVADRTRAINEGIDAAPSQARARAHTRSGSWLVLHGTRVSGAAEGQTAVIIEPARRAEMAPIIVQAYGLSGRERDVTQLVVPGLSTREIAARLFISVHTVQDHLKAIFHKLDVHSRRELVSRVSRCLPAPGRPARRAASLEEQAPRRNWFRREAGLPPSVSPVRPRRPRARSDQRLLHRRARSIAAVRSRRGGPVSRPLDP